MAMDKHPVPAEGECKVDKFQSREIRKIHHGGEWWFSVKDVVESLIDAVDGTSYVRTIRSRDPGLNSGWDQIVRTFPFQSGSGVQQTNFINIEGLFRLLQSVPSKKVEPFKKWLARVGFERLQEIENPELAVQRAIAIYRAKGYEDQWIEARIQNKVSREALTAEWQSRGVQGTDFGILTDAMSVETFGINTSQHKKVKGLKGQSLRDNMTPIELTLTTLGEQAAKEITKANDSRGLRSNLSSAKEGGRIAGTARRNIEEATGSKVVSSTNYLTEQQRINNAKAVQKVDAMLAELLQLPPKSAGN
jgi:hypothetical protein